ncbi:endonuclease [Poseidonocella sedimentorum]|uniref:Predicted 5' DNA nuclease, flap endonuclease-1-like, helix-3-turn-helix (H3TH) domain n=1 Tax=Poseidonocella sedimentorum TaxID=871652 RepID=A0A1I6CNH3_9RHOB|nr:Predicted 5' DNA nuclease, flap endonuclease-1-like, helix-3-turn-helix (H3TH) domain [Poseidonocella sedimentorum]
MFGSNDAMKCQFKCWVLAALAGILWAILQAAVFGSTWTLGVFVGLLVCIGFGLYLTSKYCSSVATLRAADPVDPDLPVATEPSAGGMPHKDVSAVQDMEDEATMSAPTVATVATVEGRPQGGAPAEAGDDAVGDWREEQPGRPVDGESDTAPEPAESEPAGSEEIGQRPAALSAPREGGADDLKRIKGVGPKLETLLHSLGFYHFDQVAAWTPDEVAWVDQNLEGFKGRVSRDDWVGQARAFAEAQN